MNNTTGRTNSRGALVYFLILGLVLAILISTISRSANREVWLNDGEFASLIKSEGAVQSIKILPIRAGDATSGKAVLVIQDASGTRSRSYYVSDVEAFRKEMQQYPSITVSASPLEEEGGFVRVLPYIALIVLAVGIVLILLMQAGSAGSANNQMMNFGRSQTKSANSNKPITFADVAGCQEEKEEMKELVEFLKDPRRFNAMGARIPKGVLLVGPPGTGKTYLARAVAGEAGVPFLTISGSDFVEMFVGVGASRVRDLFMQAKRQAPCIVFIDEIDAVGRRRGAGLGGGHDEREQTLNQLLVEMDGFAANVGVIVLAATNRVDILDPALLRPGRFDRQIVVNRPDVEGRKEVLDIYSKGKPLSSDVDLDALARITAGFTPADLENLMNEAAILAARNHKPFISNADVQASLVRVGVGTEKKSRRISDKEKRVTAYHEVGHAILQQVIPGLDPVHSISIIPTGLAGGYTMSLPQEDHMYMSASDLKAEMTGLLGGRAAEELILEDVTTGASNDIERVSEIARNMITRYGMSRALGPLQFGEQDEEIFLGKEIGHTRNYGEKTAEIIDQEVKELVDEAYTRAKETLRQHESILHAGAALLIEKEKITGEEFAKLFGGNDDSVDEQPV